MKSIMFVCMVCSICNLSFAQGGWIHDTNPLNDVTSYSTIYPYVGCSFIDINGDNYTDLFAAPKTLFLNNGNGTFSNTTPLGFVVGNSTSGSSYADLDNDGDNDIVVACVPSKVFFNNGSGYFFDSSSKAPSLSGYGSWAAAIGDFNEDRELDFIFAHANGFHPPSPSAPCKFFVQQLSLFNPAAVPGYAFTTDVDSYTNPYWSDYDMDGDMDLFIASGPANGVPDYDHCYRNMKIETGNDTLVPMTTELFATQKQDGQCYNFIDFDNDRDLDLCITNYRSAPTRMYKNTSGTYTSVSTPFTATTTNIANCWGDYDNDGDLDVIITNDNQIAKYYRNDGGSAFTYLAGGFSTPAATNGITNGDYDNDGDLDVFTNGIGSSGNSGSIGLFINDTVAGSRNFVNLKLIGVASNRSAIGAIVKLYAFIDGTAVWQTREVNAQNSFQGQNDLRVHFGLGDALNIDSIVITWPSGSVDRLYNYPSNSFYQITEGTGIIKISAAGINILYNAVRVSPNPATVILNVELEKFNNGPTYYRLTNVLGVAVLRGQVRDSRFSISIAHLSAGVYNLSILSSESIISKRILKH